jgi:hypothetical protein
LRNRGASPLPRRAAIIFGQQAVMTPLPDRPVMQKRYNRQYFNAIREKRRQAANIRWKRDRERRDAEEPARIRELAVIEAENVPRNPGDLFGILQWTDLGSGEVRRWVVRIGDRRDRYSVHSSDGRGTGSHGLSWIFDRLRAAILKRRLLQTAPASGLGEGGNRS